MESTTKAVRQFTRVSLEEQAALQNLTPVDGEILMRYRDGLTLSNALTTYASRYLPKGAGSKAAAALRAIKPHLDDRKDERQRIQNEHTPRDEMPLGEGDRLTGDKFSDPLRMTAELEEFDAMVFALKLPAPLTDKDMPANDKAHPNNEDGLEAIKSDLGPMYIIDVPDAPEPAKE